MEVGLWWLGFLCVYLKDLDYLEDLFGFGGFLGFVEDVLLRRRVGLVGLLCLAFDWLLFLFFFGLHLFFEYRWLLWFFLVEISLPNLTAFLTLEAILLLFFGCLLRTLILLLFSSLLIIIPNNRRQFLLSLMLNHLIPYSLLSFHLTAQLLSHIEYPLRIVLEDPQH